MSLVAPDIHQWVDRLSPAQTERLRAVAASDDVLPPIEVLENPERDSAVQNWLQTTVKATCERFESGVERTYTPDEVHQLLEARREERRAQAA